MRCMYLHPGEYRKIFLANYLCIGFVPGGIVQLKSGLGFATYGSPLVWKLGLVFSIYGYPHPEVGLGLFCLQFPTVSRKEDPSFLMVVSTIVKLFFITIELFKLHALLNDFLIY